MRAFELLLELLEAISGLLFVMMRSFIVWIASVAAVLVLLHVIKYIVGATAALVIANFCLIMVFLKYAMIKKEEEREGGDE